MAEKPRRNSADDRQWPSKRGREWISVIMAAVAFGLMFYMVFG